VDANEPFQGDKKLPLKSPLAKVERRFIDFWVPRFPRWIEGYHLTLTTILWSAGLIMAGHLAKQDLRWLWFSSVMLFMQWFTDSFDGALGRYRDTGIPKWGFYMDHFLDFIFMCSILIGYALLFGGLYRNILLALVPIFGAFMINSYLSFAATNEFKITFLGMGPIPVFAMIALVVVVYRTQKYIWQIDMEDKRRRKM
jgi:phosphatidylglycerophosphate synthase